ncbi:hypothetical protein GQ457_13G024310 [Hibiscus cannabinus]
MLTIKMIERSFPIKRKQTEVQAFTSIADQSSLWHRRLGHFNYSSLRHMSSKVFDVFQRFKANSENQSGKKIKTLRSDNGSKYTSRQFASYLQKLGIHHQLIVVYTPRENGVSERKNMTILSMVRCLLFEKKIPKVFWEEAGNTSVYLLNRLPTKALEGNTPFEVWFDATPSIGHLRVFGCVCYVPVPEVKRDKLDERAIVGVFLGYSSNSKKYRVYDVKTKKILVSRNLKFDEDSIWD